MRPSSLLFVVLTVVSSVVAHPISQTRELKIIGRTLSARVTAEASASSASLDVLAKGNQAFREGLSKNNPGLLQKLADEGQAPPFMFIGCSDSRVSEGTVFNALPGTMFTERNIANQFQSNDQNAQSVLSYAIAELGVSHVIVMGHYGCGGVAASIASAPTADIDAANGSIQNWIKPIREIFASSTRPEIVELRNKNAGLAVVEEPDIKEPGFRALVEENVKASVARIVSDSVVTNHFATISGSSSNSTEKRSEGAKLQDVFIHGFVYDIETGIVQDLGISVGPPGKAIPNIPFDAVAKAAVQSAEAHGSSTSTSKETAASAPKETVAASKEGSNVSTKEVPAASTEASSASKEAAPATSNEVPVAKNEVPAVSVQEPPAIKVVSMLNMGKRCEGLGCRLRRSFAGVVAKDI